MPQKILYIFQFTCLKLIVNYCIKHGVLYVNDLYIHWATIYILSWTNKKHQKILSRLLHSKLKKIQALFKDLHRNLRTFQGKMEFKDFTRTSPKIQGLFKTVRTLFSSNEKARLCLSTNKSKHRHSDQNSGRSWSESVIVSWLSGIFIRLFMRHTQFF